MNLEEKRDLHDEICGDLNSLYATKNVKYNDSFAKTFAEYGPVALALRLDDKMLRLKTLIKNPQLDPGDESIVDTLRDMANYAIMGIIELDLQGYLDKKDAAELGLPVPEPEDDEDDSEEDDEEPTGSNLKEELGEYTKVELHKIAEALDITVGKKTGKEDIIEAILSKPQEDVVEILDELFSGDDDGEEGKA
jgi:hypothetical protein